jgi:ribA/ribD-fused uncharacterized protein
MERITDAHIFFWGGEFSNWYDAQFKYKGIMFFNTEQAFMWEKALYFHDMESAKKIIETPYPAICKRIGRKIKNFEAVAWMKKSPEIMTEVNYAKYSQNPRLKLLLVDSHPKTIVEASPEDKIWGIGLHWSDDKVLNENNWKGLNLLGKSLMDVRDRLRNERVYKT